MEPEIEQDEDFDYTAVAACNYYQMLESSTVGGDLDEEMLIENILNLSAPKPRLKLAGTD
ncbi:MAG: hypothetical protein KDD66_04230 [Bdellovibrionales bacterium]|nr:hypothetical protein [Bdellovibrionales bacterium]